MAESDQRSMEWARWRLAEMGAEEYPRRTGCPLHPLIREDLARWRDELHGVSPPVLAPAEPSAEWMPVAEAARLLEVSTETVRTWAKSGRLYSRRRGKLIEVDADEVHRLVSPSVRQGRVAS